MAAKLAANRQTTPNVLTISAAGRQIRHYLNGVGFQGPSIGFRSSPS